MMAKKAAHSPVRQNVFGATLARFVGKVNVSNSHGVSLVP